LINALNKKFGHPFGCWAVKDHGKPSIFIPNSDLSNLQKLVTPHMHPTLLYKIHL
jgi:hypothetical protein